jgi:predicted nucleotidyltransferase
MSGLTAEAIDLDAMTLKMPSQARVPLPLDRIETFCRKWRIDELALFGSVLREDFSSESDIDVLVTFSPDAQLSLLDFVAMKEELQEILLRRVDLVSKGGLRNPFRRHEILNTRQIVYAA